MKKPAIQFLLALGLALSALSMSASALDYGILRPRSTVDSTGAPSLSGIPPVKTGGPPVGGALPGTQCGFVKVNFLGQFDPSVPCNGEQMPMGLVSTCAAGSTWNYSYASCATAVESCSYDEFGLYSCFISAYSFSPPISQSYQPVSLLSEVTYWRCPTGYNNTFLGWYDSSGIWSCIKS